MLTRGSYLGRADDKLSLEHPFESSREFCMIHDVCVLARLARDPNGEVLARLPQEGTPDVAASKKDCNLRSILQNVNSSASCKNRFERNLPYLGVHKNSSYSRLDVACGKNVGAENQMKSLYLSTFQRPIPFSYQRKWNLRMDYYSRG